MNNIESYYYPIDYDTSRKEKDYYPAICRAQESSETTITFDAQEYFFSKPIELIRSMHLVGSGCGTVLSNNGSGTVFKFPKDTPGIIIHSTRSYKNSAYINTGKMGGYPFSSIPAGRILDAAESIIEFIVLKCEVELDDLDDFEQVKLLYAENKVYDKWESTIQADTRSHGITCFRKAHLRNLGIERFNGHGVYLFGHPAGNGFEANCDQWHAEDISILYCAADGFHLFGGDVHLGVGVNINVLSNHGWGIVDFARNGPNTFISCHDGGTNKSGGFLRPYALKLPLEPDPGLSQNYLLPGTSNFINCYQEPTNGFLNSFISFPNIVINSYLSNRGLPNSINSLGTNGVNFANGLRASGYQVLDEDTGDVEKDFVVAKLGAANQTFPNLALHLENTTRNGAAYPESVYHLYYQQGHEEIPADDNLKGWWEFKAYQQNPVGDASPYSIRLSTSDSNVGAGHVWLENGAFIGHGTARVRINSSDSLPTNTTDYHVGDVVFNKNVSPGDNVGWIFCTDNKWHPFGKIEL